LNIFPGLPSPTISQGFGGGGCTGAVDAVAIWSAASESGGGEEKETEAELIILPRILKYKEGNFRVFEIEEEEEREEAKKQVQLTAEYDNDIDIDREIVLMIELFVA